MADTAAHLVERVLPEVPVRQWVLTLPYPLRLPCAWNPKLTSAVLRAFLRSVFADQRRRAKQVHGVRNGQCAAVTFIQRFGSALNLNLKRTEKRCSCRWRRRGRGSWPAC